MSEELIGYVELFLLSIVLLWFPFRPRKPKAVYARLNQMFMDAYIAMSGFLLFVLFYVVFDADFIPPTLVAISLLTLMALYLVYRWYWSQPFARKKTGIAAVDEAVQRYRKPGEGFAGVGGGWSPDIIVEGKVYKVFAYGGVLESTQVAFDLQGNVERDATRMDKIHATMALALRFLNPYAHIEVMQFYKNAQKAQRAWKTIKQKFNAWAAPLMAQDNQLEPVLERVRSSFETITQMNKSLMDFFVQEGEWGLRHGNTRLEQVRYEDVMTINVLWREKMGWLADRADEVENSLDAGKTLLSAIKQVPDETRRKVRELEVLLSEVLPRLETLLGAWKDWKGRGVQDYYRGMESDERERWRARLAWVDLVDSWVAQGYTGEALEAKKEAYLKAQERAERERQR